MWVVLTWISLVLVASVVDGKLQNDCGSRLLDGCFCGRKYFDRQRASKYVVECVDQGFTNADMLKTLPEETEALIFTGNNIPTLPWNVFGDLNNLTRLRSIDMSNNQIRDIKGKSYHHVPNVELLILNHNQLIITDTDDDNFHHPRVFSNFINLQELHLTNAFRDNTDAGLSDDLHDIFVNSGLSKLYKLHLEQNEIRGFKDFNVFCGLPNLRDLYMGDNFISSINFNLKCLKKLRFLDLEHNNITKFASKELDGFDRLLTTPNRGDSDLMIDISRNPLKCDSAVKILYPWMAKTNVTIRNRDSLECFKYGTRIALNVKTLSEHKSNKFSTATSILLVVLTLVLVSLLGAYAYLSRESIKNKMAPIIDKVSRKVQYTTIESQDV